MSLRQLPEIKAFDALSDMQFEPDESAMAKWNPGVHAADQNSDATISIYDVIGETWDGGGVTAKRISAALRSIGNNDVTVNINSPGGSFFEGIAIYNMLREHNGRITIKVMGLAASAASVIAMAGDNIQISEVGFLMVHNAWAVAVGNRHDMRDAADTLEPFDDAMAGLYANRAGVKKAEAAAWMDAETWFNGEKAIDTGLADGLLSADAVEESASASMKSVAAVRRVETALAKQGLPRNERRSLIGEIAGRQAVADDHSSAVASDAIAGFTRLIETIKS